MKNVSMILTVALLMPVLVTTSALASRKKKVNYRTLFQEEDPTQNQQGDDSNQDSENSGEYEATPVDPTATDAQGDLINFHNDEAHGEADETQKSESDTSDDQEGDEEESSEPESNDANNNNNADERSPAVNEHNNGSDSDSFTPVTNSESSDNSAETQDDPKHDDNQTAERTPQSDLTTTQKEEVPSDDEWASDLSDIDEDEGLRYDVPQVTTNNNGLFGAIKKAYDNLSAPDNLITYLQKNTLKSDEKEKFSLLTKKAITDLTNQLTNNKDAATDRPYMEAILAAQKNKDILEKLNTLRRLARSKKLIIGPETTNMVQDIVNQNSEFINTTENTATTAIRENQIELDTEAWNLLPIETIITRAKHIKKDNFKSTKGQNNTNFLIIAIESLSVNLKEESPNIKAINDILSILKKKDIHLSPEITTHLHEALSLARTKNNKMLQSETKEHLTLESELKQLTDEVEKYATRYADKETITASRPENDFVATLAEMTFPQIESQNEEQDL